MKEKVVNVNGQDLKLSTSAYIVIMYADIFGGNVFAEMADIVASVKEHGTVPYDKLIVLYRLTYCMAKHSDPDVPPLEEFMRSLDVMAIPDLIPDLLELWAGDMAQQSKPKKKADQSTGN